MNEAALPGDPGGWRDFRAALKRLIARSELTALAVERLSNDPAVREAGAERITDSTISRKLADRDEPVDARSVRTIVTSCAVATTRRHASTPDTDLSEWLRVRTLLAERIAPVAPNTDDRPAGATVLAGQPDTAARTGTTTSGEATSPHAPGAAPPEAATPGATRSDHIGRDRAGKDQAERERADTVGPDPDRTGRDRGGRGRAGRRWSITVVAVLVLAVVATWPVMTRATADREEPAPPTSSTPEPAAPACGEPADQPVTAGLSITTPAPGDALTGDSTPARGIVALTDDERPPWLMLLAKGDCKFYIEQPVNVSGTTWTGDVYADPTQKGTFAVYVVVVPPADDRTLHQLSAAGGSPSLPQLPPGSRAVHVSVRCCA